jgi:hypothetical protein
MSVSDQALTNSASFVGKSIEGTYVCTAVMGVGVSFVAGFLGLSIGAALGVAIMGYGLILAIRLP